MLATAILATSNSRGLYYSDQMNCILWFTETSCNAPPMKLNVFLCYLDDKLDSALLRTSGVSSTGAAWATSDLHSLSDAVSPSSLFSNSDSCTRDKVLLLISNRFNNSFFFTPIKIPRKPVISGPQTNSSFLILKISISKLVVHTVCSYF